MKITVKHAQTFKLDPYAAQILLHADLSELVDDTEGLHAAETDAEHGHVKGTHRIQLYPEAIANRMAGYALETPEEALDAIVREHALRLTGHEPAAAAQAPDDDEERAAAAARYGVQPHELDGHLQRIAEHGGTDERFSVAWSAAASKARSACLKEHADRIDRATGGV